MRIETLANFQELDTLLKRGSEMVESKVCREVLLWDGGCKMDGGWWEWEETVAATSIVDPIQSRTNKLCDDDWLKVMTEKRNHA